MLHSKQTIINWSSIINISHLKVNSYKLVFQSSCNKFVLNCDNRAICNMLLVRAVTTCIILGTCFLNVQGKEQKNRYSVKLSFWNFFLDNQIEHAT